ncbi:lycopene cyclase domain-containing protein [Flavobacterium sp. RHBU_24]|uniref:lycopene cyclase domain-containing protein n=1 Tax=Flavobacterium sp. RHBU_24 TaxID=3391185 RepID=UPI003984C178
MSLDTITYLLIPALLFIPWGIIYFFKKGIRKKMLKTSIMGGLAGFIAEYWYFKDYWHPPTVLGQTTICPEDFLFGFTVTGLSVALYEFVFNIRVAKSAKKRKKMFGRLFLSGVAAMMVFSIVLHINSIVVSSGCFLVFAAIMVYIRPDLLTQALLSGLLLLCIIVPVYAILFDFINTVYWDKYWLLSKTRLGVTILGHIPVTELCWYFSWGCMAGIAHNFASGTVSVKAEKQVLLDNEYANLNGEA